jgi:peroxiredoxin
MVEVKVGEPFPDFKVENHDGKYESLAEILKGQTTVLVLFVSEWQPYCKAQVTDLTFHKDEIEDAGGRVVLLSTDNPDALKRFKEELGFDFPLYSDQRWVGWEMMDLKDPEADHYYRPSVFVCDSGGVVRWMQVGRHYAERANYKDILAALGALG